MRQGQIMRRFVLHALIISAWIGAFGASAYAASASEMICKGDGTRAALLIGNQDYVGSMQALENPRRDTVALAQLLCLHGFSVFRHSDLDLAGFDSTVDAF